MTRFDFQVGWSGQTVLEVEVRDIIICCRGNRLFFRLAKGWWPGESSAKPAYESIILHQKLHSKKVTSNFHFRQLEENPDAYIVPETKCTHCFGHGRTV